MEAETRVVRATTAEYVAAADADIVRVLGAAEATGVGYRAAADADAFKTVAAAEATLMGSLRDSLIGSNAATLRMRYVSTVIGAPRTRLFIGDVHMSARAALPRCRCNPRACTTATAGVRQRRRPRRVRRRRQPAGVAPRGHGLGRAVLRMLTSLTASRKKATVYSYHAMGSKPAARGRGVRDACDARWSQGARGAAHSHCRRWSSRRRQCPT